MARVYAYAMLSVAMILIFNVLGLSIGAESITSFINLINGQITLSDFWGTLFNIETGILFASVGVGIIVGLIARADLENIIMIPFITGPLALLAGTFIRMIANFNNLTYPVWGSSMMLVLFGTLMVGYTISLAEWFRGNI